MENANSTRLLRFKIKNFRSFCREQTLNFASGDKACKVTAIYGPNAGGKSNITKALSFVKWYIVHSNDASLLQVPFDPFLFREGSINSPSEFEIEIVQKGRRFIYGFAVVQSGVEREYLYEVMSRTGRARVIFERTNRKLNPSAEKYGFGKKLFESTRDASLLITKARENNNEYANQIFDWTSSLNILFGMTNEAMQWSVQWLKENPNMHNQVMELTKEADLWIRDFALEDVEMPSEVIKNLPFIDRVKEQIPRKQTVVKTYHVVRDSKQRIIRKTVLDLFNGESSGTQRFFELAAPLIDTLLNGKVLYIDEFESNLHPDICQFIVSLFNKSPLNHGAQLIVNTHDTYLMKILDREEVLFVEKNHLEESVISALIDKSVRDSESFEKRYRQGLYGAKPQIKTVTEQ